MPQDTNHETRPSSSPQRPRSHSPATPQPPRSTRRTARPQATVKSYGDAITPDGAISTAEFGEGDGEKEEWTATKVDCEMMTSCAMKGCWMDVKLPDGDVMKRVSKDYGFFVLTKGLEGKSAGDAGHRFA